MEPMHDAAGEDLRAHDRFVRRLAQRLVTNADDADDVAQDAWVVALTREWPKAAAFGAWLAGIARNVSRHQRRDRARAAARVSRVAEHREPLDSNAPLDLVARIELERRLLDRVLALSEPRRSIVLLRLREDLTSAQVGAKLGLPEGTVRWHLKAALEELRARLDAEHRGDRSAWAPVVAGLAKPKLDLSAPSTIATRGKRLTSEAKLILISFGATALTLTSWLMMREPARDDATPSALHTANSAVVAPAIDPEAATLPEPRRELATASDSSDPQARRVQVRGRCVDASGSPLSDVVVGAQPFLITRPLTTDAYETKATSDREGRFSFEIECAPRDEKSTGEHQVRFSRSNLVARVLSTLQPQSEVIDFGDVTLTPDAGVVGTVVDTKGHPIRGVRVTALSGVRPSSDCAEVGIVRGDHPTSITDESGSFRFAGFDSGWIYLVADAREYVVNWSEPITLVAGRISPAVRIVLEDLGARYIAGRCIDEQGRPIQHAHLSMHASSNGRTFSRGLELDAAGKFFARALDPVAYSFTLEYDDRSTKVENIRPGDHDVTIEMKSAPRSTLYVKDAGTHGAIPKFSVSSELRDSSREAFFNPVEYDPKAPDVARFFPPIDGTLRLEVTAAGYSKGSCGPFDPAHTPSDVTVELVKDPDWKAPRRLAGLVVADGKPVANARVFVEDPQLTDFGGLLVRAPVRDRRAEDETDAKGRFEIDPQRFARSGSIVLTAEAAGYAEGQSGILETSASVPEEPVVIELQRPGRIEGRVRSHEGESLAGLVVVASREFGPPRAFRVGATGEFALEGLTPGPWEVELKPRNFDLLGAERDFQMLEAAVEIPSNCVIAPGATTRIELRSTSQLGVVLKGRLGTGTFSRPGLSVQAIPIEREATQKAFAANEWTKPFTSHGENAAPVLADGTFRIDVPRTGTYVVVVSDASVQTGESTIAALVDLVAGANHVVVGSEFGRIEGTYPESGSAAKTGRSGSDGIRVRWRARLGPTQYAMGSVRCDSSNRFALECVPAGDVEVAIRGTWRTLTVRPGTTTIFP